MTHLPACGPGRPIRARTTSQAPLTVQAVLFDFSGTLFQIGTYADRIRAAMAEPVDEGSVDSVSV
ncbi:hypothetical protein ACIQWL_48795 [Streptomyces mirabilis]|uniref:hypothetical protein n=1 Tax=Streptomyces mirabilis TaxID=68239 RepID=UPI0033D4BBF1